MQTNFCFKYFLVTGLPPRILFSTNPAVPSSHAGAESQTALSSLHSALCRNLNTGLCTPTQPNTAKKWSFVVQTQIHTRSLMNYLAVEAGISTLP